MAENYVRAVVANGLAALDRAEDGTLARGLSWARVAGGSLLLMAPRRTVKWWTGDDADRPATRLAARGLGVRDLAIAVGTLIALEQGTAARGWIEAGMMADTADALAHLIALPDLPKMRGLLYCVTSAGAAALGFRIAKTIDR
jgi:hypothetical protein